MFVVMKGADINLEKWLDSEYINSFYKPSSRYMFWLPPNIPAIREL